MPAQSDPYKNPNSARFKFRQRRFQKISNMIDRIILAKGSCNILDVGGSEAYWLIGNEYLSANKGKLTITLLNLEPAQVDNKSLFVSKVGDACDLPDLADHSFDFVHSNSVIEHVGSWEKMKRMAGEVRRLAPSYYVQTPYFWFPFEPHYASLAYHWLPQNVQAKRMLARQRGFMIQQPDIDAAMKVAQHTVLLDKLQFGFLFPDSRMEHETVFGLTKSLIALR